MTSLLRKTRPLILVIIAFAMIAGLLLILLVPTPLSRAKSLLREQRYIEAISILSQINETDDDYSEAVYQTNQARFRLGIQANDQHNWFQALNALEAIDENSLYYLDALKSIAAIRLDSGKNLLSQGKLNRAVQVLRPISALMKLEHQASLDLLFEIAELSADRGDWNTVLYAVRDFPLTSKYSTSNLFIQACERVLQGYTSEGKLQEAFQLTHGVRSKYEENGNDDEYDRLSQILNSFLAGTWVNDQETLTLRKNGEFEYVHWVYYGFRGVAVNKGRFLEILGPWKSAWDSSKGVVVTAFPEYLTPWWPTAPRTAADEFELTFQDDYATMKKIEKSNNISYEPRFLHRSGRKKVQYKLIPPPLL